MLTELLLLLAAIAGASFWYAGRRAAELATIIGREACARAGVQWLDQSVHLLSMRLSRGPDGWLGLERRYGFEYSTVGEDRHSGRIVLQGNRLQAIAGPMPPSDDRGATIHDLDARRGLGRDGDGDGDGDGDRTI